MGGAHGDSRGRPGRSARRRILRLFGWNALVLFVLLALAAGATEAYLRLTAPHSRYNSLPLRLAPGVGVMRPPDTEIRYLNKSGRWQVSRTNSLGFLDREPPAPARAAASCHVTLIGDSFVEALEVPIADKAQVRLEELAAREAPELDVTTSAFGFVDTGQINQLAFYDAFARRLSPDVVVLVAVRNDLLDNSLPLRAWQRGFHPDYPPHLHARRGLDGGMEFVPPASTMEELRANLLSRLLAEPELLPLAQQRPWLWRPTGAEEALRSRSHLADWLWRRLGGGAQSTASSELRLARAEWLSRHPRHATFMRGWSASHYDERLMLEENPPPAYREGLDAMRFALEQFRERTERDGATLVMLAISQWGGEGTPWFERLRELAGEAGGEEGIPVISQHDHIIATGGRIGDARWERDEHWTPAGHRWAAEAIWEWLKRNPEACD